MLQGKSKNLKRKHPSIMHKNKVGITMCLKEDILLNKKSNGKDSLNPKLKKITNPKDIQLHNQSDSHKTTLDQS